MADLEILGGVRKRLEMRLKDYLGNSSLDHSQISDKVGYRIKLEEMADLEYLGGVKKRLEMRSMDYLGNG